MVYIKFQSSISTSDLKLVYSFYNAYNYRQLCGKIKSSINIADIYLIFDYGSDYQLSKFYNSVFGYFPK